jgi:hypothetical protein
VFNHIAQSILKRITASCDRPEKVAAKVDFFLPGLFEINILIAVSCVWAVPSGAHIFLTAAMLRVPDCIADWRPARRTIACQMSAHRGLDRRRVCPGVGESRKRALD